MTIIENCVLLGILTVLAWLDIKKREFPLPILGAFALVEIICEIAVADGFSVKEITGGLGVGGVLLICALITKESIGVGDGLIFCITGICLGLWRNLFLLFLSAAVCALFGAVLLAAKKCTAKDSLPFAPFVLVSDILMLVLCA